METPCATTQHAPSVVARQIAEAVMTRWTSGVSRSDGERGSVELTLSNRTIITIKPDAGWVDVSYRLHPDHPEGSNPIEDLKEAERVFFGAFETVARQRMRIREHRI